MMSDEIVIRVHPETVPTTSDPFHQTTTHVDALGMPVACVDDNPYHPTPCCGAAASISDGPMYCKRCYEEVDSAFGNAPVEPFRPVEEVIPDWIPAPTPKPLPSEQPPLSKAYAKIRADVRREASERNAEYPQYDGYWDGDEWILIRLVSEFGGFHEGDLTIARWDEDDYALAYCRETNCNTAVNTYDYETV